MTAAQPPWIEKRPFSKAPLRALTSAPIVGRAVAETLQKLPVRLRLHMTSRIGPLLYFLT